MSVERKNIDTVIAERIADRIERDGGVFAVSAAAEEARIALALAVMQQDKPRIRIFKFRKGEATAVGAGA